MSTNGQLSTGMWSIAGSMVSIKQPSVADYTTTIACSGDQLTFGFEVDQRPPPNLAAALDQATAGGEVMWKAFPVAP